MLPVISDRRSVRKYKDIAVPKHLIEEIVEAGILAPSSKNRQPWKFIVTTGAAKEESLHRMEAGLQRESFWKRWRWDMQMKRRRPGREKR